MPDLASLYLFVIAALLLLIVPGPNMAFLTSHALAYGWRAGFAAALGIFLADLLLTLLVSAGVGTLVMSWTPAFELLRLAGAAYLLYIAWQTLRTATAEPGPTRQIAGWGKIFIRATLNSLLNPKALLFFMVFLPQFVKVENGNVSQQLIVLGVLLAAIALVFHSLLGIVAASLRRNLAGSRLSARLGAYGFAGLMAALAARLLLLERPV